MKYVDNHKMVMCENNLFIYSNNCCKICSYVNVAKHVALFFKKQFEHSFALF